MIVPLLETSDAGNDWADRSNTGLVVAFWLAFFLVTLQAGVLLYLAIKRRRFYPLAGRSPVFLSISLIGSYVCLTTMMIRFGVGRESFSCAGYILVVHVGIASLFIPYAMRTMRLYNIFRVDLAKRVLAKRQRTRSRPILLSREESRVANMDILEADLEMTQETSVPSLHVTGAQAAHSLDTGSRDGNTGAQGQGRVIQDPDVVEAGEAIMDDGGSDLAPNDHGDAAATDDVSVYLDAASSSHDGEGDNDDAPPALGLHDGADGATSSGMDKGKGPEAPHVPKSTGSSLGADLRTTAASPTDSTLRTMTTVVSNKKDDIPTDVLGRAFVITCTAEEGGQKVLKEPDRAAVGHIEKVDEDLTGLFRLPSGIQSNNLSELQRLRRFMSDKYLITRVYLPTLCLHLTIGIIQVAANSHYRDHISDGCVVQLDLIIVLLGYFLIYVSVIFYCWYILRHVDDGFQISRELRYTFWVWTLTGGVYLLVSVILLARDPNASSPAYLLFVGYLGSNMVSLGWPVYLTYKQGNQARSPGTATSSEDTLQAVLDSPPKKVLLREFLTKEFSSENLLFLEDVQLFRTVVDPQAQVNMATDICAQYIAPLSPLEVNIPSSSKRYVEGLLANGDFSPTMFDKAYTIVFNLLESDSFQRFIKTPKYTQLKDHVILQRSLMQTANMV